MVSARRTGVLALALALLAAACGSRDGQASSDGALSATSGSIVVENQGGSMEGHTPRGFAGSGTGLFVGDNLNPGFPDGDGVQLFVTFDLPGSPPSPSRALIRSEVLSVAGDPFADLGELVAEPVTYDAFGAELFALGAGGEAVACRRVGETGLECDVTAAVVDVVEGGGSRVQLRLRFETAGDGDGQQDLALFFLTDSNTNEPGIFTLELS